MSPWEYDGRVIEAGEQLQLNACGLERLTSGTAGEDGPVNQDTNEVIRRFPWDFPWGGRQKDGLSAAPARNSR